MAHGRPLSRHGRYDAFVGMSVTDSANSGYDPCAPLTSPERNVVAQRMSTKETDSKHYHQMQNGEFKEQFTLDQPNSSPDESYHKLHNMSASHRRPPSSSGLHVSSGRPPSASKRTDSARRRHTGQHTYHSLSEDKPAARPPSSFSKYRPLPAIGTPVPADEFNDTSTSLHLESHQIPHLYSRHIEASQLTNTTEREKDNPQNYLSISEMTTVSISSDKSVKSSAITSKLKNFSPSKDCTETADRLHFLRLNKSDEGQIKKSNHRSPFYVKPEATLHHRIEKDTGDIYDGDDDDSNSPRSSVSNRDTESDISPPKSAVKKPVIIPSPENPPAREVLLAVKLPTDGTRHQKYFNSNETLQSIIEFAEEVAGQSFENYILVVASAPKNVYVDLEDTIENAGLEDKSVLHLEEYD